MIWQQIDFKKLAILLLPPFLRRSVIMIFFNATFKPLDEIYNSTFYKMQHDSRVIYLEKMLNEEFAVAGYSHQNHNGTKKIYITDTPEPSRHYIYQPEENQPLYLGTVYLGGGTAYPYQFIVHIPDSFPFVEAKLRAIIDYYKLAGKKYIIETYTL